MHEVIKPRRLNVVYVHVDLFPPFSAWGSTFRFREDGKSYVSF